MATPHDIALQMPSDAEMDVMDLEDAMTTIEACIEDNPNIRSQALCVLAALRKFLPAGPTENVTASDRPVQRTAGGDGSPMLPAFSWQPIAALPDSDREVLLFHPKMGCAVHCSYSRWPGVTHWMPLPNPPALYSTPRKDRDDE